MENNMQIWDKVKHVDQKYTKAANVDGNRQTAITALYPVQLMTRAMGPIGGLWRYTVVWEKFVNTKPIMHKGEILLDNGSIVWEQDHTLFMQLWTRPSLDSEFTVACEQYGHTKYKYVTNKGEGYIKTDTEYAKKSCSDALKKCLSLLGVCADVFMGDFDDRDYVADVQDKLAIEKADKNSDEEIAMFEEMKREFDDGIESISKMTQSHAIKKIFALKARYFKARQNSPKFGKRASDYIVKLQQHQKETLKSIDEKGEDK